MNRPNIFLEKPNLLSENQLNNLVENKTSFTLSNCELNIFETHKTAFGVNLPFDHLSFTGMLRGKKVVKLEGKTDFFDYLPGESTLVGPGETMIIDFPEADQTPAQCISLSLSPEFVQNSLYLLNLDEPKTDENSNWKISLDEYFLFNNPSLAAATNNIMRIAMDSNVQKDLLADFALKELLIRLMQTQARSLVAKNTGQGKSRISFVAEYIKKNLHEKLSIDAIAKLAFVSKSNLFKIFKQEIGISPNEFILQERIQKAKKLLKTQQSINEIAYQTGFSDANYFTRVFKQFEGVTPKSFQRKELPNL